MVDFTCKLRYDYEDLLEIMKILRAPGGCPWDAEQTHRSILRNFQEETYEFCEAAELDDEHGMCEELGDVLMQVVFHAQIEAEQGRFTMEDVCDGICKKMIFRHPHVFGSAHCETSGEVLDTWDAVKRVEKSQKTVTDTLRSVARTLPALWRAEKIERKAAKAGFHWASVDGALAKLEEEVAELRAAIAAGSSEEDELGDLLLAACDVAAMLELDPERALHAACEKFIRRFAALEEAAAGQELHALAEKELTALWIAAKQRASGQEA